MKVKNIHNWYISMAKAKSIQIELSKKLDLRNRIKKIEYIAGCDVGFKDNIAYAAVTIHEYKTLKLIEKETAKNKIRFPYIPGYLTFREGPILSKALSKVNKIPDVIMFDGQGIAHPRNMGIATHMGILLNKPTIGCAKSLLCGNYDMPNSKFGSFSEIKDKNDKIIGVALRTRTDVKPVFVSSGYKIDLETAVSIVLSCTDKYKIPEPLRSAHNLTQEIKK